HSTYKDTILLCSLLQSIPSHELTRGEQENSTVDLGVKDLAKMTLLMNESYADRRLPHHRNPKEFVPLDHLADLWVMENLGQSFRARSLNLIARMHHSLLSVPTLNAPLLMRHYFSAPSFLVSNFPSNQELVEPVTPDYDEERVEQC
ncbi:RmlC-like cupins superfamily protein, partial [Prunus dulcis]